MHTSSLRLELENECLKHIRRYEVSVALGRKRQRFFEDRTELDAKKPTSLKPVQWDINPAFNPFYVRKRLDTYAHSISARIQSFGYEPHPALHFSLEKPDGGVRTIAISTIPDAAVSRWLFRRLIARNIHRLSSYAFAYRPDRKVQHAVEHLQSYVRRHPRLFLVEYDFASYFDTISHDYLERLLSGRVCIGRREFEVTKAILRGRFAKSKKHYQANQFARPTKGIPQGNCLSLFLANLACIELDDELEKTGACYARYADDTVILCQDYVHSTRCASIMHAHESRAGTELNLKKSDGICLLTSEPTPLPELRSKGAFNFLGHEIRQDAIGLSAKTQKKIKRKLATIIHRHLLFYPSRSEQFSRTRIDLSKRIDWDLVTCLNDIRKYIYGKLTEEDVQIDSALAMSRSKPLQGVVAFFSSITCGARFSELDGWLANALQRALAERRRRLWRWFRIQTPLYALSELIDGSWYNVAKIHNETRLPSFVKAWKTVRRLVFASGMSIVPDHGYNY